MKKVLERDGWRCRKCGSLENLQVHHGTKRSQQGNDSLGNLVTLCMYCHMAEHGQLFYSVPAARVCRTAEPRTKCGSAQSSQSWPSTSVGGGQIGPDLQGSEGTFSTERLESYEKRFFQFQPLSGRYAPVGGRVFVCKGPDGNIASKDRGRALLW